MNVTEGIKRITQMINDARASGQKLSFDVFETKDGISMRRGLRWEKPEEALRFIAEAQSSEDVEVLRFVFYNGNKQVRRHPTTFIVNFLEDDFQIVEVFGLNGTVPAQRQAQDQDELKKQVRNELMVQQLNDQLAMERQNREKYERSARSWKRKHDALEAEIRKQKEEIKRLERKANSQKIELVKTISGVLLGAGASIAEQKFGLNGLSENTAKVVKVLLHSEDNDDDDYLTDDDLPETPMPSARLIEDDDEPQPKQRVQSQLFPEPASPSARIIEDDTTMTL